jgi:hypothetical protein
VLLGHWSVVNLGVKMASEVIRQRWEQEVQLQATAPFPQCKAYQILQRSLSRASSAISTEAKDTRKHAATTGRCRGASDCLRQ